MDNYCYSLDNAGIHVLGSNFNTVLLNTIIESCWGISLISSSQGIISDNICEKTESGIYCQDSTLSTIKKNQVTRSYYGIELESTSKLTIQENTCNFSTSGMDIIADSDSIIQNNYFNDNKYAGIDIHTSTETQIENNTLFRNVEFGIKIYKGTPSIIKNICNNNNFGIRLRAVDSLTISNNTCKENLNGIVLEETDFSTISHNILQKNIEYGIKLCEGSTWNKIHHNYFICNNINGTDHGTSQAFDEGYNNRWYERETEEGNYWTDYKGVGEYKIDGKANNSDPYPLIYSYECPTIIEPTESSVESFFNILVVLFSFFGLIILQKLVGRYRK